MRLSQVETNQQQEQEQEQEQQQQQQEEPQEPQEEPTWLSTPQDFCVPTMYIHVQDLSMSNRCKMTSRTNT